MSLLPRCQKCGRQGSCFCSNPFKTLDNNKINPPTNCKNGNQCFCDGSCKKGQNISLNNKCIEFNGNLFIEEQPTLTEILNNLENYILNLTRYDNSYDQGIVENEEGEYIRLEDVLALFGAKKD